MSTLFQATLDEARSERALKLHGKKVIRRRDCPVETTAFGVLRWYMHPKLTENCSQALYFCELEIPTGSRSGRIRHQGGIASFVVEGSGYTLYEGVAHEWSTDDLIGLPAKPAGIEFQHFNTGNGPVRMLISWPNFDSALGAELGVEMEVIEPAPEFAQTK